MKTANLAAGAAIVVMCGLCAFGITRLVVQLRQAVMPLTAPSLRSTPMERGDASAHGSAYPDEQSLGLHLAMQQCGRCHMTPRPDQLPKDSWPIVLNAMGNYLGYPSDDNAKMMRFDSLVPKSPLCSEADFQEIRRYYLAHAPSQAELIAHIDKRSIAPLSAFMVVAPPLRFASGTLVTMVHADVAAHRILVGAGGPPRIEIFDRRWQRVARQELDSPPVNVELVDGGFRLDDIGNLWGLDEHRGTVLECRYGQAPVVIASRALIAHYPRLVQHASADLDADGQQDLVLAAFGQGADGRVSIFWGRPGGGYDEQVLLTRSGALAVAVADLEGTGRPDILVLMAQGRNELLLFRNRGYRHFDSLQLKEWSSSFGLNGMCLADIAGDGRPDIVVVNGNSIELPRNPLRPYHGVHVLRNRGGLRFEESYFYPMYGAIAVAAGDLMGQGRTDLAVASFCPDWGSAAPESATILAQTAPMAFSPQTLGAEHLQRWVSIAIGDLEGDGISDVILGGGYNALGMTNDLDVRDLAPRSRIAPHVLVLRNRRHAAPAASASPPR